MKSKLVMLNIECIVKQPQFFVDIKNTRYSCLLDTGASVCIVKKYVLDKIDDELKIKRDIDIPRVSDAGGNEIKTYGFYYIHAKVGENKTVLPCVVVGNDLAIVSDFLIGMPFLKTNKMIIDFVQNKLFFPIGAGIDLFYNEKYSESVNVIRNRVLRKTAPKLICRYRQTIGPNEGKILSFKVNNSSNENFIFEPFEQFKSNIDSGIVKSDKDGRVQLLYVNATNDEQAFERNTTVGTIQPIDIALINTVETKSKYRTQKEVMEELRPFVESGMAKELLLKILAKNREAIALPGETLGKTDLIEMSIKLKEGAKPIALQPYRVPHSREAVLKKEIQDLIEKDIIEPTVSSWSSPCLLLPKKNGTFRLVVDYRKLNEITEVDTYPLPNISEVLMKLDKAKYYSNLDLKMAYHQVPIAEDSKAMTAFRTADAHYAYKRCPFGLASMPSIFSRLMAVIFEKSPFRPNIHTYLDDILISTNTADSHLKIIDHTLELLAKAKLRIRLEKCEFFKQEVKFLGFVLTQGGYTTIPNKIEAINKMPAPKDVDLLRRFLGMTSFYRMFIENYAKIADPLFNLLKKDEKFRWNAEHETAFERLKEALTSSKILAYPDFSKPFILETDASNKGIGCVISQEVEGEKRPISFASRSLSKAEKNYDTTNKEALAVVWALKKYRYILLGYEITAYVDHQSLVGIFKNTLPPGRLGRWALAVQEYNITIKYKPGRLNQVPDTLSRLPVESTESQSTNINMMTEDLNNEHENIYGPSPAWDIDELIKEQQNDPIFGKIYEIVKNRKKSNILPDTSDFNIESNDKYSEYQLRGNILHMEDTDPRSTRLNEVRVRIIVPETLAYALIESIHKAPGLGHLSGDKLVEKIERDFVVMNLAKKVKEMACHKCNLTKRVNKRLAPKLKYPIVKEAFHQLHFDILGPLSVTERKNRYIICFVDRFTRFTICEPLADRTALSVCRALYYRVIVPYTTPKIVVSDNALEFLSRMFQELCNMFKIKRTTIVSYHPNSNGLAENTVKRILGILRKCINVAQGENWDLLLPQVETALNTNYHVSVGDTPHYLVFLQDKILPSELRSSKTVPSTIDGTANFVEKQRKIYEIVEDNLERETSKFIDQKNVTVRETNILPGHRVYIKKRALKDQQRKLAELYEGPYRVLQKLGPSKFLIKNLIDEKTLQVHSDNCKLVREPQVLVERHQIQLEKEIKHPETEISVEFRDKVNLENQNPSEDVPASDVPTHRYNLRKRLPVDYRQ